MTPRRIGILGYDQVTALDIVGPAEAFASAVIEDGRGRSKRCYQIAIIGLTKRRFVADSGIVFEPTASFDSPVKFDTLIIPGGQGLRDPLTNRQVVTWLMAKAKQTRRVASVCTGLYGLAATGLMNGRRVTTHWRFTNDVVRRFPKVKMEPNALFVKDGKFYSSAGVTAGIDLTLALIEEDFGPKVALNVARELVVYLKRSGGQEQFSEPLQFQTHSDDRLAEVVAWMANNPNQKMSIDSLARRASLSPRHFYRRFKEQFGSSPATFIETLRLNEARRRLTLAEASVKTVAQSVGFNGADSFRRAFTRRFRITPGTFRRNFSPANEQRTVKRR